MTNSFFGIVVAEETYGRFVTRLIKLTLHHLIERTAKAENGEEDFARIQEGVLKALNIKTPI